MAVADEIAADQLPEHIALRRIRRGQLGGHLRETALLQPFGDARQQRAGVQRHILRLTIAADQIRGQVAVADAAVDAQRHHVKAG